MAQPIQADRVARYVEKISAPDTVEEICIRIAGGESLQEVCSAWDVPLGRIAAWIAADQDRTAAYDAACRIKADMLAHETVTIADEDKDAKALRINTRFRLASALDKARYGTAPSIAVSNSITLKIAPEDENVI